MLKKIELKTNKDRAYYILHKEFNEINLNIVEKEYDGALYEKIINPSDELITKEFLKYHTEAYQEALKDYEAENGEMANLEDENFLNFVYSLDYYSNQIDDYFAEMGNSPMWCTMWEARNNFINDGILKNIDELYKLGVGVIDAGDNLGVILFIAGAGYDFIDAHFIPVFKLLLPDWMDLAEK
jgi:hypothetical protein